MNKKCPSGTIRRKEYTRKDGTYVRSTCVIDKGKSGKTVAANKVLPRPVKGNLSKYGYSNVKNTKAAVRRAALLKGVKDVGYNTIIRRVNLVANFNKNSDPRVYKIFRSDIEWMKKNLSNTTQVSKGTLRKKKLVKAGTKIIGGRSRQLYHVSGSTKKFYQYRKADGGMGRRYI